jgi:fructose-1-phosphate kinase PfkB-like protein
MRETPEQPSLFSSRYIPQVATLPINSELLKKVPLVIKTYVENGVHITHCSAWPLDKNNIIDTTGAGDAFIGGFLSGLAYGFSKEVKILLELTYDISTQNFSALLAH